MLGLVALAGSVLLSAAGQLGMKAGMLTLHGARGLSETSSFADMQSSFLWTGAGLVAYGASLVLWLIVLVRYPLSKAYPLLSLSYVCVYLGATLWPKLGETATPLRTFGTLLILAGVAFVSFGPAGAAIATSGTDAESATGATNRTNPTSATSVNAAAREPE